MAHQLLANSLCVLHCFCISSILFAFLVFFSKTEQSQMRQQKITLCNTKGGLREKQCENTFLMA